MFPKPKQLEHKDVGKTKAKIEISPVGGDTAPHLSRLPPHD